MKTNKLLSVLLIILLILLVIFISYKTKEKKTICFNEACFEVEIADNHDERIRGLMFRDNLNANQGMLFIYELEGQHYFWMKNTKIPLDIIWIDKNFKIVFISHKTLPCKTEICQIYGPDGMIKSLYVLEVNAGVAEDIGLKLGDEMVLKH